MTRIIICLILLYLVSCSQPSANPRADLELSWSQFIDYWESEDAEGCASLYTVDGQNIAPEAPIRKGRQAIAEFYAFLFDNHLQSEYHHEILQIESLGAQAFELGQFTVDWIRNDSTLWTFKARSMTHWKKESTGQWKIETFLFNRDEPEG